LYDLLRPNCIYDVGDESHSDKEPKVSNDFAFLNVVQNSVAMALLPVGVLSAALVLTFVCTRDVVGAPRVDLPCHERASNCNREGIRNPMESYAIFCQFAPAFGCLVEVFSSAECANTNALGYVTQFKQFSDSVCGENAALFEANWHCFDDESDRKGQVCFIAFQEECNIDDYRTCLSSVFDPTCAAEFVSQVTEFELSMVDHGYGGRCAGGFDISGPLRVMKSFFWF